jgi:hypothetical protein
MKGTAGRGEPYMLPWDTKSPGPLYTPCLARVGCLSVDGNETAPCARSVSGPECPFDFRPVRRTLRASPRLTD